MTTLPISLAKARVEVLSMKLERTGAGAKIARLRMRQPSTGAVVEATAHGQDLIDRLMALGRANPWMVAIDRTVASDLRLVSAKRAAQVPA